MQSNLKHCGYVVDAAAFGHDGAAVVVAGDAAADDCVVAVAAEDGENDAAGDGGASCDDGTPHPEGRNWRNTLS